MPRRGLRKALVAAGAAAATAALLEVLCRVAGVAEEPVEFRFLADGALSSGCCRDPELFWRALPDAAFGTNAAGTRGELPPPARDSRELRIACVGDSCTFGFGVRLEETWGVRLRNRLQDRVPGGIVRTILAACPGYSTHQSRVLFERVVRPRRPDLTVLYVGGWNDVAYARGRRDSGYAAWMREATTHPFWSLRVGRLLRRALEPEDPLSPGAVAPTTDDALRVSLPELRENVAWLIETARESGPVVGILPPIDGRRGLQWPLRPRYMDALRDVYARAGVPIVDAQALFDDHLDRHPGAAAAPPGSALAIMIDSVHPRPSGHGLLAEALEPVVLEVAAERIRALQEVDAAALPEITLPAPLVVPPGKAVAIAATARRAEAIIRGRLQGVDSEDAAAGQDGVIRFRFPPAATMKPGPSTLVAISRAGPVTLRDAVVVGPWEVSMEFRAEGGRTFIDAAIDTEGPIAFQVLFAREVLEGPIGSPWGQWRLSPEPGGLPEGAFRHPRTIDIPGLTRLDAGRLDEGPAPLRGSVELSPEFRSGPIVAQTLVRFGLGPGDAILGPVQVLRAGPR